VLKLAANFVPAADEVYRMQNLKTGTDPECRLFQKFSEIGHYRRPGSSRQGTYCVSPSGVLLGSINSNDPERIAELLEKSLTKWAMLKREERLLPTTRGNSWPISSAPSVITPRAAWCST
jgi:hypothetical protein